MNNASRLIPTRFISQQIYSTWIFIFHVHECRIYAQCWQRHRILNVRCVYQNFDNDGDARSQIYRSGIFNLFVNKPHTYDFFLLIEDAEEYCWVANQPMSERITMKTIFRALILIFIILFHLHKLQENYQEQNTLIFIFI